VTADPVPCLDCHRPLNAPESVARKRGRHCQEVFEGDTHISPKPRRPMRRKRLPEDEPFPNFPKLTERTPAVTEFVQFIEVNDHEGETWNFWLQRDGNEDAIAELRAALAEMRADDPELPYTLADETTPESEVDVLVTHSDSGYMAYETKVVGSCSFPDNLGEDLEDLYKGGIKDYFTTA
jgi:hypothetical protein